MSWRLASRLAVVTSAALVIIVLVVVFFLPKQSAPTLQGTDLGSTNAPDFRLTDQFGNAVSLSQFRGHPVVLTFLYTHCPDQCPLIADKIHLALEKVGSRAAILACWPSALTLWATLRPQLISSLKSIT